MPAGTWVRPEIWYAQLPTVYAATSGLITDQQGRVLLVKPNYRDYWTLPGGMVDAGEAPEQCCVRELAEELGLQVTLGPLLLVDWAPPVPPRPRPLVYFLFDAGVLADPGTIRLQYEELDDYRFCDPTEAAGLQSANVAHRVPAALAARRDGTVGYPPHRARPADR